jgi:L-lactate dehydrogenase complex protein LldF
MSTTKFRQRIRKSIANESLKIALNANAERRVQGRINSLNTLPNWREKRQQAHAVRADVIEHLDEYLEQFAQNATQNGITIHRAKDADEAIKHVLNIAGSKPHIVLRAVAA